jgi:ubiquinone/menaquinone biosynthesis C-methylase UbiE
MDSINDRIRQYLDGEGIIPRTTSEIIKILGEKCPVYEKLDNEKNRSNDTQLLLNFYEFLAQTTPTLNIPIYDLLRSPLRGAIEFYLENAANKIRASDTVLSVGCNTGLYETFLAKLSKKMIYLDFSRDQLAVARERAKRNGLENAEFKITDMNRTNLQLNSIDVLLCFDALKEMNKRDNHPFDNPFLNERIKEFRRVLKKGSKDQNGRLIIGVTAYPVSREISFNKDAGVNLAIYGYLKEEAEKLKQKIEKNGFSGGEILEKSGRTKDYKGFASFLFDLQVRD